MKKTIIALLALAGVAIGEVTTVSTSYNQLNGQDIAVGFILSLDAFFMESSSTLGSVFDLDSVTIACSADGGTYASSAKLAIFERPGADSIGTFVGLSEAATHVSSGNTTYDFSDTISLATNKQYQFFFVANDTSASIFSTTEGNATEYAEVAVSSRFDRTNVSAEANFNKNLPTGCGIMYSKTYSGQGIWSGHNMAVVTLTSAVPEPTTSTLSLLALAGLCARRRRRA